MRVPTSLRLDCRENEEQRDRIVRRRMRHDLYAIAMIALAWWILARLAPWLTTPPPM